MLTFGTAHKVGDLAGTALNAPIVGAAVTPSGNGYYLVGRDGGVFTFGDAHFHGSTGGLHLNAPVLGIAVNRDNSGYWLAAGDGGVFAFHTQFRGSMGGRPLNAPVIGISRYGDGYLLAAADGGIFDFSDDLFYPAPPRNVGIIFQGPILNIPIGVGIGIPYYFDGNQPVVAVAAFDTNT